MPSAGASSSPAASSGQIVNLYGRSIGAAFPHRLLPRSKGGLFAWESVSRFSTVILVEGLFDLAVLWQAGFRNTTCAIGTQLTPAQLASACRAAAPFRLHRLRSGSRTRPASRLPRQLARRLQTAGVAARIVQLPQGHDPNSYFVAGATAADFTALSGSRHTTMKLPGPSTCRSASASPYRLLDEQDQRIAWANAFLDGQHLRQLSLRSLRAYAYDLLHFARWWSQLRPASCRRSPSPRCSTMSAHQLDQQPQPTPQTVNHRLDCDSLFVSIPPRRGIPAGQFPFPTHLYDTLARSATAGHAARHGLRLRLKQPRRVILPLSAEQVAKFWGSFRTFRDLALVGLMLLDGLRSCEVLALQLEDLQAWPKRHSARSGQRQEAAPLAAARGNHGSAQSYLRWNGRSPTLPICSFPSKAADADSP